MTLSAKMRNATPPTTKSRIEIHAREMQTYEIRAIRCTPMIYMPMRCILRCMPVRCTPEMHAHDIHAYEMHTKMHAREVHA